MNKHANPERELFDPATNVRWRKFQGDKLISSDGALVRFVSPIKRDEHFERIRNTRRTV